MTSLISFGAFEFPGEATERTKAKAKPIFTNTNSGMARWSEKEKVSGYKPTLQVGEFASKRSVKSKQKKQTIFSHLFLVASIIHASLSPVINTIIKQIMSGYLVLFINLLL